jgi:hypothetical protein
MDVISEESPDFIRAWDKKEQQMIFSNVPVEQRILLFEVKKDDEYLEKAYKKIEKSRQFLNLFAENHKNFNNSFKF